MISCSNCGLEADEHARFCPHCGTRLVAGEATGDPLLGTTLNGKYRVDEKVGSGSMGTVYRGEHLGLRKSVALKVLHADLQLTDETLQRFQREGIAAGKFSHPNAIQVFDFDRADGSVFFLAMEFVEGQNLKALLRERERLPVALAVDVVQQVLEALAEAHEHGIVHRDLKPENIMVLETPSGDLNVKVLDFGLSKLVDAPLEASLRTEPGRIMGTPLYMAPEQGAGDKVDHKSDLYSVGLILHELLTGQPPFAGRTLREILVKHATEPAPSLVTSHPKLNVPGDLDDVILRALEKDPEDRFESAREMLDALAAVDLESSGKRRRHRSRRRSRPRAGAGAPLAGLLRSAIVVLVVAAIAAGGYWAVQRALGTFSDTVRVSQKPVGARSAIEARYVERLDEARSRLRTGDTDEALRAVEEAAGLECVDSEAFLVRGTVYRAREDDDTALADFQEALALDPGYAAAAASIGWIWLERGDFERSAQWFEDATELAAGDRPSALALAGLGALCYLRGEVADAELQLLQATELDAGLAAAHLYLGRVRLDTGRASDAVGSLVQAKRNDARSVDARAFLGRAYLELGRLEDAQRQLQEALGLDPNARGALEDLGSLLVASERWREAADLLVEPAERHPERGRLQILVGVTRYGLGDTTAAMEALERGLETEPDDARAQALLGILYHQRGRLAEAEERYRLAVGLDPRSAEVHLNLGLIAFQDERYEEAAESLERAIAAGSEDAFAYYGLGIVYMNYLGDAERARLNLEAYQDLGGDDERVDGWLRDLSR